MAIVQRTQNFVSPAVLGTGAMLIAVLIFGSNFAFSRHATLNGFTAWDLVALRFLVAGMLLLPVFLAHGGFRNCAGVGWRRGVVLAAMSGFPLAILMMSGLSIAPASHGATIAPGTVAFIGAVGSFLMFGVRLAALQILGLAVVLGGLAMIAVAGASAPEPGVWRGDLLFLACGLVWGVYPLLLQRWKVGALTSTAIVAVLSLIILPYYFLFTQPRIFDIPLSLVLLHGFNQGVLNVILALWLWAKAVDAMGAGVAGRFPPLVPVIGTLIAIPLLGEIPGPLQIVGIACIVGGLLVVALGRRPARPVAQAA